MEYHPRLGNGHSIFFEAFVGGGLIGLAMFIWLFLRLNLDAAWLFFHRKDSVSFAVVSLFMAVGLIGLIGGELDSGQVGFTFWFLVAALPYLRRQGRHERRKRRVRIPSNLGPQAI